MTSQPPASVGRRPFTDWVQLGGLGAVAIGAVLSIGGLWTQVQDDSRRITAIESSATENMVLLHQIDTRTARLEQKFDDLVPRAILR